METKRPVKYLVRLSAAALAFSDPMLDFYPEIDENKDHWRKNARAPKRIGNNTKGTRWDRKRKRNRRRKSR